MPRRRRRSSKNRRGGGFFDDVGAAWNQMTGTAAAAGSGFVQSAQSSAQNSIRNMRKGLAAQAVGVLDPDAPKAAPAPP